MSYKLQMTRIIHERAGEWAIAQTISLAHKHPAELHLFINIANKIIFEDGVLELNEIGIKIISEIQEKLDMAAGFDDKTIYNLVHNIYKQYSKPELSLQIVVAMLSEKTIYFCSVGGALVYLFRNNSLVKLSNSAPFSVVKGEILLSDIYLLSQKELLTEIGEAKVRKLLASKDESFMLHNLSSIAGSRKRNDINLVLLKCILTENPGLNTHPRLEKEQRAKQKWIDNFTILAGQLNSSVQDNKKTRKNAFLGMSIIVLLLLASFFGYHKRSVEKERNNYLSVLNEATYALEEATRLKDLDRNLSISKFYESEKLAKSLSIQNTSEEITSLQKKVESSRGEILGIYNTKFDLYLDLSLIKAGFSSVQLTLSDDTTFILAEQNTLVKLNLNTKRSDLVKGISQAHKINKIASYYDAIFLADDLTVNKLEGNQSQKVDEAFSQNILLYSYAGNLYVLDRSESKIWRYTAGEASYSQKKEWLSETNKVDLSKGMDMAIDGSIWVLSPGQLVVLTSGQSRRFNLENFPQVKNIDAIYTDENIADLYLLDRGGGLITRITKEGKFIGQYSSPEIKEVVDFVYYSEQNRLYLLTKDKILFADVNLSGGDGGN